MDLNKILSLQDIKTPFKTTSRHEYANKNMKFKLSNTFVNIFFKKFIKLFCNSVYHGIFFCCTKFL